MTSPGGSPSTLHSTGPPTRDTPSIVAAYASPHSAAGNDSVAMSGGALDTNSSNSRVTGSSTGVATEAVNVYR